MAVITPNQTAVRKVRIIKRSKIFPAGFDGEFEVREAEVEYACNISPKTVAVRNIRISKRKQLKPSLFPGEFEGVEQE